MKKYRVVVIISVIFLITACAKTFTPDFQDNIPTPNESREIIEEVKISEPEVSLVTDKLEYYTNSIVTEGVTVEIFNNLDQNIFYLVGCAAEPLSKHKYDNGEFKRVPPRGIVCAAMPSVVGLKSKESATLGIIIQEKGTYKLSLSYSLEKNGRWEIGETKEAFTNTFEIKEIDSTLENSLQICEFNKDFSDSFGGYYPKSDCLQRVLGKRW